MSAADRLQSVLDGIAGAARVAARDPTDIVLVAVSKGRSAAETELGSRPVSAISARASRRRSPNGLSCCSAIGYQASRHRPPSQQGCRRHPAV